MNDSYYTDFCTIFHETMNCPIHLYVNGKKVFGLPSDVFPFTEYHHTALFGTDKYIAYCISESSLFYSLVKSRETDHSILIGPYAFHPCTHTDILNIMKEYSIPQALTQEVTDYFHYAGNGLLSYFFKMMQLVNFFLNREKIDMERYLQIYSESDKNEIAGKHSEALAETKEQQTYHNTYQLEKEIYKKVEEGDISYFGKSRQDSKNMHMGRIADNNLRQVKNIFIVSATLSTRAAIAGGLSTETAFQLSDEYIQTMERQNSIETINRLGSTMLRDFAERVNASRIPNGLSKEVYNSIQYIQLHTNSAITVQSVADSIGISRSYLSKRFKAELGFDISSFIMRCKLEEARSLLSFTDKSLVEISNYLCFSSQSYFTNVFKGKYGITPREYRSKNSSNPAPDR